MSEQGRVSGPFSERRIRDLIRWGKVSEQAVLCDTYLSAWIPIRRSALAAAIAEQAEGALPPAAVTAAPISARSQIAVLVAALAAVLIAALVSG